MFFSDNLLTNLIQEAVEWDKEDNQDKQPCLRKKIHLEALVKCINSCGVCFSVWEKRNADGKGSATFDYTSLMGSDKKKLLQHLPSKLGEVIRPKTSDTVTKLWKVHNIQMHILIIYIGVIFLQIHVYYIFLT